ncbi:MAG: DUF2089 domain-containing protein [candidate division Zixibacteria bacterium]|nr:DUF2089 domain-containing protein [candidate division Zixibacteria bacterium]
MLVNLAGGRPFVIERVRLPETGVAIEGEFTLPPLAALPMDEQVFVAAFVRSHGSIKAMEEHFGVSYPTIKSRLNRIADKLTFVAIDTVSSTQTVIDRLERGEITVEEALGQLHERGQNE